MFYKFFKYQHSATIKSHYIKVLKIIVLLLAYCSIATVNAQTSQSLSDQVDSLTNTFPKLINNNAEQARKNVEKALVLNEQNKNIKIDASCNYFLGKYYRIKGNNRMAINYLKETYNICLKLNDPLAVAAVLNEIGITYKNLGEYDLAIQAYIDGIELCEDDDFNRLADIYTNLANLYVILKNYDLGLDYFFKSLELEEDVEGKEIILLDIGTTYHEMDQDSLAMAYYEKALILCDKHDLPRSNRNDVMHNIADALIDKGEYAKGLAYLIENDKYNEAENNLRDVVFTKLSIAAAYQKMNNLVKAQIYIKRCIELGRETESMEELLKAYKIQSELYKEEHQYKKSLDAFEVYVALKDSMFNIEKTKYTEILIADFEADKKENEILLLKKEKELQEKELMVKQQSVRSHKVFRNITIAVATLLLIGAFLIVFFYQQKVRDGQLLALKTEEVNKQHIYEIMRDHEFQSTIAGIKGREKERKRIAQELHDGIGGNLASIKLKLTNAADENPNEQLQSIIKNVDDTYQEVRTISHNLISFEIRNHAFTYLVDKLIKELSEVKELKINLNFFPEYKLNELSNDIKIELYRIIQELMNNIIKHAQATQVDIQIIDRNESVNLMVEDNGIGYNTQTSTQGIGLKNIRSRVKSLKGTFNVESSVGNWTLANVEIPLTEVKNNTHD